MSIKLNKRGYEHAKQLIVSGRCVLDSRGCWSEHRPSVAAENQFIRDRGFGEYALWHLGVDDEKAEDTKWRYEFPYGDLHNVHRCALLAAESRAGQYAHGDVELAAAHLLGMLEPQRIAAKAIRADSTGPSRLATGETYPAGSGRPISGH